MEHSYSFTPLQSLPNKKQQQQQQQRHRMYSNKNHPYYQQLFCGVLSIKSHHKCHQQHCHPIDESIIIPSATTRTSTTLRRQLENQRRQQQAPTTARIRSITTTTTSPSSSSSRLYLSSFTADGSEYSADTNDFEEDSLDGILDRDTLLKNNNDNDDNNNNDNDSTPTIELQPVPMSKNSGNRFAVILWDHEINQYKQNSKDVLDLHKDRIALTEDHVMFCRKANLYNDTFNTDSMVDVLWSLPILSSDLLRVIGHVMILESTSIQNIHEFLSKEPIVQMLCNDSDGSDLIKHVPIYRWRHIRDFSLRIDDGRFGFPCMCLALDGTIDTDDHNDGDDDDDDIETIRNNVQNQHLEYMIRSERIIAAGPLYVPTELKDDSSSIPIGDLILFNAKDRKDAIEFVENLPGAIDGLYDTMKVHFYNQLDITGKFVSEDPLRDAPCEQMKEAMDVWGYPVHDHQTPWLNW